MKPLITFAALVALALTTGTSSEAITLQPSGPHRSPAEVKRMIHEAHTPDRYRAIARYYDERHADFSQKASDEMAEWARRSQNTTGPAAKYPRPVDSARNLYEYYAHEADNASFQADKYYRFATGAAATSK
jgi:hypothetical protein